MSYDTEVKGTSVMLALGALANLILALCLAHTWKYWRQVKWYIILLTIGNFLEVTFTLGIQLGNYVAGTWNGSTSSCRFLVFMGGLGPSLSAMGVAALAVHVLLTSITSCQGNKLRHSLVLGLFVVLSLPMPLAQIPFFEKETYWDGDREIGVCYFASGGTALAIYIGNSVAMVFFPLFVWLNCVVATGILFAATSTGTVKGEEDKSDLILTVLLGLTLMLCAPFYIFDLVVMASAEGYSLSTVETLRALQYLLQCRCIVSALVVVVFAYVHAFRNRGDPATSSGERQKLVN